MESILIERVTVDFLLDTLQETLTWIRAPTDGGGIRVEQTSSDVGKNGLGKDNVASDIVEEVAELRDAELNSGSQSCGTRAGANLVVLKTNSCNAISKTYIGFCLARSLSLLMAV